MAVPKKRTSVSRKGKRRAGQHHKLYATKKVIVDKETGELTLKGYLTPSGTFKGLKVFTTKAERVEAEEATPEA